MKRQATSDKNQDKAIRNRKDVPQDECWDLSTLYKNDQEWEDDYTKLDKMIKKIDSYKGRLGESASLLKEFLDFAIVETQLYLESLGNYAMLRISEDVGDTTANGRYTRYVAISTRYGAALSFMDPEIQGIEDNQMAKLLASEELADYNLFLDRLLRFKPHILTEGEERLLARQAEFAGTAKSAFSALTDVDFDFGKINVNGADKPLTNTTFGVFMINEDREVRKKAYNQFYGEFTKHSNTLAALYSGSVKKDIFMAETRGFKGSVERALFPDNVPEAVYTNLIAAVHKNLPALHEYYSFRKELQGLKELHQYDTKVSLIPDVSVSYTYDEAVSVLEKALAPMGSEYVTTLCEGLKNGWVDKYENKNKRSGAFSSGSYKGEPFILMNYKEDDLRHLFTLAHEGGHSMHSWYSVANNTYQDYDYTIFEAETASTFNEQLLTHYLFENAQSKEMRCYLLGRQLDDIIGTIYRQTMFAEYELIIHRVAEGGTPLTLDFLRSEYRKLLELYFGPAMVLEESSDLEGLRIPHFYRAFYVYKYATGLSAAITLSRKVLEDGESAKKDYISFLKSGGSQFPLDSLKMAGVDMATPEPVDRALKLFKETLDKLKKELA